MPASTAPEPDASSHAMAASFRQLAENVPGAVFRYLMRADGTDAVEYMSARCVDLWEIGADLIQDDATLLWQMIDPQDQPGMQASVMKSAQTLEPWLWEWRITTPSGRRKWLEGRGVPERQADGSVRWNSLILDVTERRRTEDALRESERRLSRVLAAAGDGIWEWKLALGIVTHNRRWSELLGIDDGLLQRPIEAFERQVHDDDRPRVLAELQACLEQGLPLRSEHRMRRADGRVIWVEARGDVAERDADGRALLMVGSVADITSRKLAELELRVKDAAIDSSLNGIALADLDGRLTYVNPAFCRMWGIQSERALGKMAIDFWRLREHPERAIQGLREHGSWTGEMEGVHENGEVFHAQVSASMVVSADGQPLCMMGSFVDITARRQAQDALRQLNDELERRVAERTLAATQARVEAERANRSKSEFLSSMSHELRTPMNAVLGFGQLLELEATLSPRGQGYLRELLRAGHHLLDLINEVLDLARVEAGHLRLSIEAVELAPLLQETLALLAPTAAARQIQLPQQLPEATLRADRMRLKQVLVNLVSNAVKYNRPGGQVRVDVGPGGAGRVRVTVSDTGKGIARERLSELFQPFQRLSEDVAVEGTGIGLVITLRLIELMGGAMGVDSEIGQGSRFWFELPPATPAEALVHPAGPQLHQLSGATDGAPRLVLYIDDNPANLRLMTEIIALEPRLRLLTAATPGLGLDLARAEPPALILLDLQLPEMSGLALLELLRQEPALAKVPVVAVTSQGSERDIAIGTAAGFDDYIVKPFAVNRLLATVARLLGRPGV